MPRFWIIHAGGRFLARRRICSPGTTRRWSRKSAANCRRPRILPHRLDGSSDGGGPAVNAAWTLAGDNVPISDLDLLDLVPPNDQPSRGITIFPHTGPTGFSPDGYYCHIQLPTGGAEANMVADDWFAYDEILRLPVGFDYELCGPIVTAHTHFTNWQGPLTEHGAWQIAGLWQPHPLDSADPLCGRSFALRWNHWIGRSEYVSACGPVKQIRLALTPLRSFADNWGGDLNRKAAVNDHPSHPCVFALEALEQRQMLSVAVAPKHVHASMIGARPPAAYNPASG